MAVIDGRTWLELLSPAHCWQMLEETPVGRLGVLNDSAPEIYPVNHVVDHRSIVFRTDHGSKLRGLLRSPAVCFEVDAVDPATDSGWSVLVKGRAVEVVDADEQAQLDELHLRYWSLGEKQHWIRIVPTEVSGRRLWSGRGEARAGGPTDADTRGDDTPEGDTPDADTPEGDAPGG